MSWTVAPAAKAALSEATRRWPDRDRSHDGTIGDTAHSARKSDHNPDAGGWVMAFDLSHDPAQGCDAHALVRAAVARRDPRIKYAISQGRIWAANRAGEGWRVYGGANKHDKHAHVSIARDHRDDTSPWWVALPAVRPAPTPEDEPMTPEDRAWMTKLVDDRLRILLRAETADGKPTGHPNLRDIEARLDALALLVKGETP